MPSTVTAPPEPSTAEIHVVTVLDGAAFDDRMCAPIAFTTWAEAEKHGRLKVAALRQERRDLGETDEAFVEAIHYTVVSMECFGTTWMA